MNQTTDRAALAADLVRRLSAFSGDHIGDGINEGVRVSELLAALAADNDDGPTVQFAPCSACGVSVARDIGRCSFCKEPFAALSTQRKFDRELFDAPAFYAALKRAVDARGVQWKDVAAATGVSTTTLSRMSGGRRPDAASLAALSAWAGINPANYCPPAQAARLAALAAAPAPADEREAFEAWAGYRGHRLGFTMGHYDLASVNLLWHGWKARSEFPSAAPVQQPADRAWLVERRIHGYGPKWWGFNFAPDVNADWCSDANNAIRFSRKEDAERMRAHILATAGMSGEHDYANSLTATEHEWVSAQAAQQPADTEAVHEALIEMEPHLTVADWFVDAMRKEAAQQPAQPAEPVQAWRNGRDAAAAFLLKKRDDFCQEFGSTDPDTGTLEFGHGDRAEAQDQWVNDLEELADAILALCPSGEPAEGPFLDAPVAQQVAEPAAWPFDVTPIAPGVALAIRTTKGVTYETIDASALEPGKPTYLYAAAPVGQALTDSDVEAGWRATFSTENPYCPCNLKSFTKAVRWVESRLQRAGGGMQ